MFSSGATPFEISRCREELQCSYKKWLFKVPEYIGDINGLPIDTVFNPVQISQYRPRKPGERHEERPKELSSHNEVFAAECDEPARRILFTSRKGCGMSTLVAKMAHEWVTQDQKSPLKDFKLLFVLDLSKVGRMTLEQAITKQLLPNDTDVTCEQLKQFLKLHPSDVVFFLCGYDRCNKRSLSDDIKKLISFDFRRETLVVVTTHNWTVPDFHEIESYKCYEVQGFPNESVQEYIRKAFIWPDNDQKRSLLRLLDSNDLPSGVASDPILISLLCRFWKSIEGKMESESATQLYSGLFNFIHECTQSSDRKLPRRLMVMIPPFLRLRRKNKPVPSLSQIINDLGQLALESSWLQNAPKQDFTITELREALQPSVIHEAIHMGLLRYGFLVKNPRADILPNIDQDPDISSSETNTKETGVMPELQVYSPSTEQGQDGELVASVSFVQTKFENNLQAK